MLISHGIDLDTPRDKILREKGTAKTKKSPRFSENLSMETEFKAAAQRKENESYGNSKRISE